MLRQKWCVAVDLHVNKMAGQSSAKAYQNVVKIYPVMVYIQLISKT